MKIDKIEVLRIIAALTVINVFAVAPLFGLMYGSTPALTFGSFTIMSPLEFALTCLGTKSLLINLIVPTLVAVVIIVVLGRFFCGWICPVGLMLEYTHTLTARKRRKGIGTLWKNREKYVALLAVLAASFLFNFILPYLYSPPGTVYRSVIYFVLHGIIGADLIVIAMIFAIDFLAVRFDRTWCNSLCPLGTTIGSLSILNLLRPKVDQRKCIDFDFNCLHCENICPMRIPLTRADHWTIMYCNKCLKCWTNCPVKAVKIKIFG